MHIWPRKLMVGLFAVAFELSLASSGANPYAPPIRGEDGFYYGVALHLSRAARGLSEFGFLIHWIYSTKSNFSCQFLPGIPA